MDEKNAPKTETPKKGGAVMRRNKLPEACFSTLPGTGQLIILKQGVKGYYPSDWETGNPLENKEIAALHNARSGFSPAQVMAMQIGSMFGFDVLGAVPQSYFDEAKLAGSHSLDLGAVLYTNDTSERVEGQVYEYQVASGTCFYLDPLTIPESIMGRHSGHVLLADLVHGKPLIPVDLKWMESNVPEMTLEYGAFDVTLEQNAGYEIIAKVDVGPVEYALGELDGEFPSYVTWERTPANDGGGPPNYYRGHYFERRSTAIQDFCGRAAEKFEMLSEQRKPSIKKQLAVKPVTAPRPPEKPLRKEER